MSADAGPWKVYARWLKDSARFNEWMNPIDYEMEDTAAGKDGVAGEPVSWGCWTGAGLNDDMSLTCLGCCRGGCGRSARNSEAETRGSRRSNRPHSGVYGHLARCTTSTRYATPNQTYSISFRSASRLYTECALHSASDPLLAICSLQCL